MKNTLLFLLFLLLVGCITPGKVSQFLDKPRNKPEADVIVGTYTDRNPDFAARLADKYLKESTDTQTDMVFGNSEQLKSKLAKAEARADSLLLALNNEPVTPGCEPDIQRRDKVIASLQSDLRSARNAAANLKPDVQVRTITKTIENEKKAEEWRLKQVAQTDSTSKYKALYQVKSEDYANLEKKNRFWMWSCIGVALALAASVLLHFKR